jgi:hypothetical protein
MPGVRLRRTALAAAILLPGGLEGSIAEQQRHGRQVPYLAEVKHAIGAGPTKTNARWPVQHVAQDVMCENLVRRFSSNHSSFWVNYHWMRFSHITGYISYNVR